MTHRLARSGLAGALFVAGLLTLSAVDGATRCLSVGEARLLWPREHLYWYASSGKRCWSNNRRSRSPVARSVAAPAPAPRPPTPWVPLPPELTLGPYYNPPPPPPPERHPTLEYAPFQGDWPGDVVYTTFAPGQEPDVWPPLEPPPEPPRGHYWTAGAAAVLAILTAGAILGVASHLGRVRLEKPPESLPF